MKYHIIYDGNCHLCTNFTKLLEQFDRGKLFDYIPMQEQQKLAEFGVTSQDCEMGMILIDGKQPERRWQGSDAAEEIANLLPLGETFIAAYRAIPGAKWMGDRAYAQIRDNRYNWFGKTNSTYHSNYPFGCQSNESCAD